MTRIELTGANLIAGRESRVAASSIESIDPLDGVPHEVRACPATDAEVDAACLEAAGAFPDLSSTSRDQRALLLRDVAHALEANRDAIVAMAERESRLGIEPRLAGEFDRMVGQFKFFAEVVLEGSYLDLEVEEQAGVAALYRVNVPVGPVAVFAASNFPLAFGPLGTDTASALAAGCSVVVKAHPAQPLTSELVVRAASSVIAHAGLPAGCLSLVHGFEAGRRLIQHPNISAGAFTGSLRGGLALQALARERAVSIPLYAEMGSANPVIATRGSVEPSRRSSLAHEFVDSMTSGVGQFCTKPGILFLPSGPAGDAFVGDVVKILDGVAPAPMLQGRMQRAWLEGTDALASMAEVHVATCPPPTNRGVRPRLLQTDTRAFASRAELREEYFGPSALIVRYKSRDDLLAALGQLSGALTATVHAAEDERDEVQPLIALLERIAGRVVYNGWPTGVRVAWAMHHGGPYPATTDAGRTSVGAAAISRFVRPVAYQGLPIELVPSGIAEAKAGRAPARFNGTMRKAVGA